MRNLIPVAMLAVLLPAQTLREGYADALRALPANAGNVLVLVLTDDTLVWFTGTDLVLAPPNAPNTTLLHFGSPIFGAFTVDAGHGRVLFGDGNTGDLWLVPLRTPQYARVLANLPLLYDAAMLQRDVAVVSAKTTGYATPDNDLVAVDLVTGTAQPLAQVPGASGPVLVDGHGNLLYATASLSFPTPPASVSLLRFQRAAIDAALQSGTVLGAAQAQVLFSGIDAAADLALDTDGDVLFVDWYTGRIGELNDVGSGHPWRTDLLDYGSAAATGVTVQFAPAPHAEFEPFQPPGARLFVYESDYAGQNQLRAIAPRRPETQASIAGVIPAGAFALITDHGPANGSGLCAIGLHSFGCEWHLPIPGFEQQLWWDAGLLGRAVVFGVSFDAAGHAVLPLQNPGFARGLTAISQTAVLDATAMTLGSSAPLTLQLGR